MAVVSSPTDAIFKADILYEYDALVKAINDNLETLDKYLCIERKHQWAQAVQSGDPDKLAQFVSRDPFAKGEIVKGELHIRVRQQLKWDLKITDIYVDANETIKVHYHRAIHQIDSASGILNYTSPNSQLLPPLIERETGGYFDLRSKTHSV